MATLPNAGSTAGSALPAAGGTSEQTLSNYIGPYVTNMLGKAQAIANEPYQVYQGPMTAGTSNLQNKVFQGLGNLSFPGNLGQSFASPMGGMGAMPPGGSDLYSPQVMPQQGPLGFNQGPRTEEDWKRFSSMALYAPGTDMEKAKADFMSGGGQFGGNMGTMGGGYDPATGKRDLGTGGRGGIAGLTAPQTSQQPSNIAQSYMNPYLQSVLTPQLDELRRQNDITNMNTNAKLTQAGGFGGGRQAIMNAENNRNLMQEQNKTVGQGYASAYDKAMGQFNTEQGQSKDLVNMLANAGAAERGIEQEGITADYNEFLAQRDDPMKKTQYLQSMLQGLPISTVTNTPLSKSGIGQLVEAFGGMTQLEDALKKLKLG